MTTLKKTIGMDFIVDLLKGDCVVFCGHGDEPSVEITMKAEEQPADLDSALDEIRFNWDW